ncbi:MAG: hypothetical protein JW902_17470 [Syntrophaceae bacterium]|nr:hypothetical protein [Syntrophaceae bacterium]
MHTPYCPSFKTVLSAAEPAGTPSFRQTITLKRFRRFIETTDWDQALLQKEKWLNRCCWLLVSLSLLYFAPILAGLICP